MVVLRDAPYFRPNADPVLPRLKAAARLPVTWEMSFLYAIVFGGFVAFSNYLPTYITTIYGFSTVDAGARTAGFALAAVLARPVGGWLSDRIAPRHVVLASLAGTALLAFAAALQPPPEVWSAATFITLAVCLRRGHPKAARRRENQTRSTTLPQTPPSPHRLPGPAHRPSAQLRTHPTRGRLP